MKDSDYIVKELNGNGNFNYNEYNNIAKALSEYYESIGFDYDAVWDIRNQLTDIYNQMNEGLDIDENHALGVINNFVKECIEIKNASLYPLSMQECLQALILIALYPLEEYEPLEMAAYDAAHIFHTFINHAGE